MEFVGMTRESHRRVAVRRISKDIDNDEEIAEIEKLGFVPRSSEITPVHQYSDAKVLAGEFKNVGVYMTNKVDGGRVRKWSETGIKGNLRLMHLEEICGLPIAAIRLNAIDYEGLERNVIFEYELPLNFKFEAELTNTFAAIQTHIQGEYLGFLFTAAKDRIIFSRAIDSLQL